MKFLEIENLRKVFAGSVGVQHFDIAVERGEFISFLGPSGCGKTTTLRMVAGFEQPTAGSIRIDGRDVVGLRPNQRNIGMVFQSYALFPNMTVAQNIAFGLKIAKRPEAEIKPRVAEMLEMIKLPHLGDRYPYQLSGGQQQRVALARALAGKPQLLLLDEPLSALDAKIRASLRSEIRELQRKLGITTIYVTHDQEEALAMSDRIVVMSEGRIEQLGTPFEIYNRPNTRFVASFVGTLNILRGVVSDPQKGTARIDEQEIRMAQQISDAKAGDRRAFAVRPEAVSLAEAGGDRNALHGTIEDVSFLGAIVRIRVRLKENVISLDTFNNPAAPPPERGRQATISFAPADLQLLEGAEA
ncbi:putative spermidine/putrescine transport system ATP-binding protein [Rhizobiales bacterium GAS191]|jgi:putative spermidine/putrescine transport system ATP-binding protein|nr:putative spermidine/putrescine transport system ATP-binding protein [Rhizobiales bacterium GAS113]SEC21085.1 putative spermidine/putrescine transport system ATP-binding protein [Rhizobiales bacterium GAS191]SED01520.1 putative spermidine/putrescine transport system ATP-binding protein [Rhizobiales bacterium GAS188]